MGSRILETIGSPEDLRRLSLEQLGQLAAEIRERIIQVVCQNGGHLASNLGVVELTLALHRVFDFRRDRLLWDVGHQCYVHKLITGRNARFDSLRQAGGSAVFPASRRANTICSTWGTRARRLRRRWGWPAGTGCWGGKRGWWPSWGMPASSTEWPSRG